MLGAIFGGFLDFLYPKSDDIYELESLSPAELVRKLPPAKDLGEDTLALFAYHDERVQSLVWELKYRKNGRVAASLASLLYDVLRTELADRVLFENFTDPLLIPVPMSETRRRGRGWNQTEVLSLEVKKLDTENILEYRPDILRKVRHTESQTLREKKERMTNVQGSMEADAEVRGRNVILLDDVTTTGATFTEAKRKLRESGASKILCVALAH